MIMPLVPLLLTLASAAAPLTTPSVPGSARAANAAAVPAIAAAPAAQCPAAERRYCDELARLARDPAVRKALTYLQATDSAALQDLIMLTQIPAPPFQEEVRARKYAEMLRAAGADSVHIDEVGNVIALRRGRTGAKASGAAGNQPGRRVVAVAGHLDTVFPAETDLTITQRGDTLFAPGIADDTRGLIAVLYTLKAMQEAGIRTDADLLFIGSVGEEGLGDLRGVKHLFREGGPRIDAFIAIDGSSDNRVVAQALGSRRYRVTFKGPGGHSWGAFGGGNPAHALGRAVRIFDEAAATFTASGSRTSYNVGRIGGGTSVNSIPFEAWMEVDMRSESQTSLLAIDSLFRASMRQALEEQNRMVRHGERLSVELEQVGDRPSGETDPNAPLLLRALAGIRHFGGSPSVQRSSTDSNIPIALGIPAITMAGGGSAGRAHSMDEYWVNQNAYVAVQRLLLVLAAEGGMGGGVTAGR
jgi:acetylornithine deacetylase/succinyl-diaminopimelate desuccinylase-like protein